MPAFDDWHGAVRRLDTARGGSGSRFSREVRGSGFTEPDYFEGTVAQCFCEITVGWAWRHELDEPL